MTQDTLQFRVSLAWRQIFPKSKQGSIETLLWIYALDFQMKHPGLSTFWKKNNCLIFPINFIADIQ